MAMSVDVAIVGGGVSGLVAAREILKAKPDAKILVLEAQDRVGGRTKTIEMRTTEGEDRWDVGGQWVGRTQTDVLGLLQELHLDTYAQFKEGDNFFVDKDGKAHPYKDDDIPGGGLRAGLDAWNLFRKLERYSKDIDPKNPFAKDPEKAKKWNETSVEEFLQREGWTTNGKEAVELCLNSILDCAPKDVSVLFLLYYIASAGSEMEILFDESGKGAQVRAKGFCASVPGAKASSFEAYRIAQGAQAVAERLAEELGKDRVRLSCPVKEIIQGKDQVTLKTSAVSLTAKRVIVALPPCQVTKLSFSPSLPEAKAKLLSQYIPRGGDTTCKFIATYSEPFWRQDGRSGEMIAVARGREGTGEVLPALATYDATTSKGSAAIVGFADLPSHLSDTKRTALIVEQLVVGLGAAAAAFIEFHDEHWYNDAWAGGCVASLPQGAMGPDFPSLMREPVGLVHWAGTETAEAWTGYISGAVNAGKRAAKEVAELI